MKTAPIFMQIIPSDGLQWQESSFGAAPDSGAAIMQCLEAFFSGSHNGWLIEDV